MHWPTRQPAIKSEGTVFPTTPISVPMPAVTPPKVSFADALAKRGVTFPLGGWAPGAYDARCLSCQEIHLNTDKRSIQCLPCAIADQVKLASVVDEAVHNADVMGYRRGRASVIDAVAKMGVEP